MFHPEFTETGFILRYRDRVLLQHSPAAPLFETASGRGRIRISHGMYHLQGEGRRRWSPPGGFSRREEDGRTVLHFHNGMILRLRAAAGRLHLEFSALPACHNRLRFHIRGSADETLHGCGEQFSSWKLNGRRFPLWTSEPGVGRTPGIVRLGANIHGRIGGTPMHTYFPQPTFVSTGRWFLHAASSVFAVFDFRRRSRWNLVFHGSPKEIILGGGTDAPETLGSLSALLGRQKDLPEWAQKGMWLACQGGSAEVEKKAERAGAAGIRLAAVWSQDWQGIRKTPYGTQLFWNWQADDSLYPDLEGLIERLGDKGIRFLGYINPFLAADGPQFAEASSRGFLVKDRQGQDYITYTTTFPVGMVDFSHPGAAAWFRNIIRSEMVGKGLAGWMADFAEYIPADAVLADADPAEYHNRYPVEWARINADAVEEAGRSGDIVFFTRSGYTGQARYSPLMWAGDQLVNFHRGQGLPTVVCAGLTAGISGMGYFHFDIGGFISVAWIRRGEEHWMRSAELAAFTPVMRSHEGIRPEVNAQFDSSRRVLDHLARMTRIFNGLLPYNRHLVREYRELGLPPMRYPWLHYPETSIGRVSGLMRRQYLYGRDLLVAPVIKPQSRRWKVELPGDDWVHLWSGREYGSGRCRIPAPPGEPPVFYRKNSEFAGLFRQLGETDG